MTSTLLLAAVVLLAVDEERAAVWVALVSIVAALVGAAVTASQRS